MSYNKTSLTKIFATNENEFGYSIPSSIDNYYIDSNLSIDEKKSCEMEGKSINFDFSSLEDFMSKKYSPIYYTLEPSISSYDEVIGKIYSYQNLQPGWDNEDSIIPPKEIVNSSLSFLEILKEKNISSPESMISGNGEISLFWENETTYIEISFYDKDTYSLLIEGKEELIGIDNCFIQDEINYTLLQTLKIEFK